jgi:lactoylglutathione lyase
MTEVASIVLFSHEAERTAAFYRALGIDFDREDHGDGLPHDAADLGDVHVAVFPAASAATGLAPVRGEPGTTFVGFYVPSLEQAMERLAALGSRVLEPHQVRDWGCRSVVEDPDGRAVEINQRQHCDPPPGDR